MPFEVYSKASDKSIGDYLRRNNPLADARNVQIVRGLNNPGCDDAPLNIDLTYQVNGAGASVDFTQNTALTGLRYYKIRICDGQKNEVWGLIDVNATTTPVNVVTSALDASQPWAVTAFLSNQGIVGVDCACEDTFNFTIGNVSANPTATHDTNPVVGALAVSVDGTPVASGATHVLAGASVDDVVKAAISITNATADSTVRIALVSGSGDGSFSQVGYVPVLVQDDDTIVAWQALIDTSSAAVKTFSVTIDSDDAATPYTFDIECTVS